MKLNELIRYLSTKPSNESILMVTNIYLLSENAGETTVNVTNEPLWIGRKVNSVENDTRIMLQVAGFLSLIDGI